MEMRAVVIKMFILCGGGRPVRASSGPKKRCNHKPVLSQHSVQIVQYLIIKIVFAVKLQEFSWINFNSSFRVTVTPSGIFYTMVLE